jgi:aminoglycoside phosphotransferase (APT) family kinase protein
MQTLLDLLQHLDATRPQSPATWRGWIITPITGGANNLLYRVSSEAGDYAVKFMLRDARDRAGREAAALQVLHQAGLQIAPRLVLLERDRYAQPVVVQTWLAGQVLSETPQSDGDWRALLDHYRAIHSVTPAHTRVALAAGFLNVSSGTAGQVLVRTHAAQLPPDAWPASLRRTVAWLDAWSPPAWATSPRTLVRVDSNWRNFLRGPLGLQSVDWENSGWGDPAFELAELTVHPAYEGVPQSRWNWLISAYKAEHPDPTLADRVKTYTVILLAWWLVRWARYLYEVPRGLDARLVERAHDWQAQAERHYSRYLARFDESVTGLA